MMRDAILVDTNIWIDYFIPQRPRHERAVRLIDGCADTDFTPLIAASCLSDLFYNLQASAKTVLRSGSGHLTPDQSAFAKEYAWGCLENALSFATVVGVDLSDAWLAQKHRRIHDDFEDDLVIAAALRAQPDYLVTNDEKLLRHSPWATLDVDDAIKLLELP